MSTLLWLLVGLAAGIVFLAWSGTTGRMERKVLAAVLVAASLVYVAFALLGDASGTWLVVELVGVPLYAAFGFAGVRGDARWLAAGWGLHPVWDFGLHLVGRGSGFAPDAYVLACITFDLVVAVYVALRSRPGLVARTAR